MKHSLKDFCSCGIAGLLAISAVCVPIAVQAAPKPVSKTTSAPAAQKWQWVNSLRPKGTTGPLLQLSAGKRANYVLVLPANPPVVEQKAAVILSFWLKEISGANFRILREGSVAFTEAVKAKSKFISIGQTQMLQKSGLGEAKLNLGEEGYAIAAKGSTLFLLGGKTRGGIYAVYSLLEEDLGCRWYALPKSSNRIPKIPTLSFKPVLRHFVPALVVRDPYHTDAFNGEWSLRNKTQSVSAEVPPEAGGFAKHAAFMHTYNLFLPPDRFFKDHPEYYALVNGKRQPSQLDLSNPDVFNITLASIREHLTASPDAKFISVSQNDGRGYCECPICSALDKREATAPGSKTGSLLHFVNRVAAALEPEFPNIKFSTLAYLDTFLPPKTIRPRKNVVVQLCTDSHAWKYPFCFVSESQQFQSAMKAWDAIGADIYIWDYITNFPQHMVPHPNMPTVQRNIQFYIAHGAKGVMLQGNTSLGGENSPMRSWVWAKQLWDPSRDTRTLMKDFIYGYYGTAAEPIWQYNMLLWQMWVDNHKLPHDLSKTGYYNLSATDPVAPLMPDWPVITPKFLADSTKLFAQAEKLAKDPETLQRVRMAKLPIIYTKLGRALGYYPEVGGYKPGPWVRQNDLTLQPYYRGLLKEYKETTTKGGVTKVSERTGIEDIIGNWTTMVERDWKNVPVVPFKTTWKFKTDPERIGEANAWFSPQTDDKAWSDIQVYGRRVEGWESQGFKDYKGATWYRQNLPLPAKFDKRKYTYLFFNAVDSEAEVYVNGVKAFDHTIASTGLTAEQIWNDSFIVDASNLLKVGEANTIAVKVTSYGGVRGIWQPVFLVSSQDALTLSEIRRAVVPYNLD